MEILLLLLLFSLSVPLYNCAVNTNCSIESACSCTFHVGFEITLAGFKSGKGDSFVSTTESDLTEYRFYPCGVDIPWDKDGECQTTDTACQHVYTGEFYSIGATNSFVVEEAVLADSDSYLSFKYTGGTEERLSTVKVICSTDEELKFLNEFPSLEYNLEFKTPRGCPSALVVGNAPALLILVILVLFIAAVTYLVVGIMLMVFWKGARGFEIIPNLGFWKDSPFLFKDGILFCFSYIPAVRSRIGGQKPYSSLK